MAQRRSCRANWKPPIRSWSDWSLSWPDWDLITRTWSTTRVTTHSGGWQTLKLILSLADQPCYRGSCVNGYLTISKFSINSGLRNGGPMGSSSSVSQPRTSAESPTTNRESFYDEDTFVPPAPPMASKVSSQMSFTLSTNKDFRIFLCHHHLPPWLLRTWLLRSWLLLSTTLKLTMMIWSACRRERHLLSSRRIWMTMVGLWWRREMELRKALCQHLILNLCKLKLLILLTTSLISIN